MKKLLSIMLFVVLAVTSASSLIGCSTTKYTITFTYLAEDVTQKTHTETYSASRENQTLWTPQDVSGYRFHGWYETNRYVGNKITEIVASRTGDFEVFGLFAKTSGYTVTYKISKTVDEETVVETMDPNEHDFNPTYTFSDTNVKVLWQPDPIQDHVFSGWREEGGTTLIEDLQPGTFGDKTVVGSWIPETELAYHNLTFKFWDAIAKTFSDLESTQPTYAESELARQLWVPANDKPEERAFDGWYINADFTGTRYDAIPGGSDEDITYYGRWRQPDGYERTKKADDFFLHAGTANEIKLSDFYGEKPVLLNFWSSKCNPCKEEMPYFQNAFVANGSGEKIEFLMINNIVSFASSGETVAAANEFITSGGYTFGWHHDNGSGGKPTATARYMVTSFPTTVIVDKWGFIVFEKSGGVTQNELNNAIALVVPA